MSKVASCRLSTTSVSNSSNNSRIITVQATPGQAVDTEVTPESISYADVKVIGNGSFGVVYQARLLPGGMLIAIKKVMQDRRYKNREIDIMRKVRHPNIVSLLYYFYSSGDKRKDEVYLNLVLEYIPETAYNITRHYAKKKQIIPFIYTKIYTYQLLRALSYLRTHDIAHRDVKPQNLLIDPESSVLKLCDFGSAKKLVSGVSNVAYICSRYYRAPELIFGSTFYGCDIDTWSAGCVFVELLLGRPIFPGDSAVNQIVEIIKILGTPTKEDILQMNPDYQDAFFPQLKAHPWSQVLPKRTPALGAELADLMLVYNPKQRINPLKALAHPFFDDLRDRSLRQPNGRPLPEIFNFTKEELSKFPFLENVLIPPTVQSTQQQTVALSNSSFLSTSSKQSVNDVKSNNPPGKKPRDVNTNAAKNEDVGHIVI
ncbi:hypothetical protein GJ496_000717 [Pomphorhynchus laevis]|nr:hypothetical protein GJ496_000717 [Pomphorhynchus laevis]